MAKAKGIAGYVPAKKGGSPLHTLDTKDNSAPMDGVAGANSPENTGHGAPVQARKPGESMADWNARRAKE